MSTKSILILGGSGFIGSHLASKLSKKYKVFATYHSHPYSIPGTTYLPFSLDNKIWMKRVLHIVQPDTIIYLLGNNDERWIERKTKLAEHLHSDGPGNLVNPSEATQPRFIYISTPHVFDGAKGNYKEYDILMPNSLLGRIKIAGENVVKSKFLNYVIIRSSPLFGRGSGVGSRTFFDKLRLNLSTGQPFEATPNEVHSFGAVEGLAEMIHRIIDLGVRNKILNYGGITKLSYFEFARKFALRFKFDPNLIVAKRSETKNLYEKNAVLDFSLNSSPTVELLKVKPLLLEESFDLIDQNLVTSP
jgi:dTDP-4-dehydrorhamnose reductase